MITYVVCDLFESPARVLVNTVNTVGVMGKGIAKDFKQIYPDMFRQYQRICEGNSFDVGDLWLYKTDSKWVLNFPTKRHWRQPSQPKYIESGLKKFAEVYHVYGITSVSFPMLGCGNGELDWESEVRSLMERFLNHLPINIFIHLQDRPDAFTPEHRDIKAIKEWLNGEPESLAFAEVWNDLENLSRSQSRFSTFDNHKSFNVTVCGVEKGMAIRAEEKTECIPAEAVLELWQQIRQSGFIAGDGLPYGLDVWADYILPVMAKLPYVKPVVMARRYGDIATRTVGLRLSLRPRMADLPLFTNVGIVEPA